MSEPGVVEGFEQPLTFKNKNNGRNKTQNGPKNCPYGSQGIQYNYIFIYIYIYGIYIYMYICKIVYTRGKYNHG